MSNVRHIDKGDAPAFANQTANKTRDEKITSYGSAEFTQALTEAFHRAKRHAIQADCEWTHGNKGATHESA